MGIVSTVANARDALRQARGLPSETWEAEPNKYEQWDTDTRFEKAAQIVDRRDGHAAKRARDWQLITAGSVVGWILTAVILGGGWYQQAQIGAKVFAVPVDQLSRQGAVFVPQEYRPTAAGTALLLKDFIKSTFIKSSDPNVNGQGWQFMRAVATGTAVRAIAKWDQAQNTDELVYARIVQNIGSRPTASPNRWFVSWDAIEYAKPGEPRLPRHFEGEVTIEFASPSAEIAMINPSGMIVTDFIWAEQQR